MISERSTKVSARTLLRGQLQPLSDDSHESTTAALLDTIPLQNHHEQTRPRFEMTGAERTNERASSTTGRDPTAARTPLMDVAQPPLRG